MKENEEDPERRTDRHAAKRSHMLRWQNTETKVDTTERVKEEEE